MTTEVESLRYGYTKQYDRTPTYMALTKILHIELPDRLRLPTWRGGHPLAANTFCGQYVSSCYPMSEVLRYAPRPNVCRRCTTKATKLGVTP